MCEVPARGRDRAHIARESFPTCSLAMLFPFASSIASYISAAVTCPNSPILARDAIAVYCARRFRYAARSALKGRFDILFMRCSYLVVTSSTVVLRLRVSVRSELIMLTEMHLVGGEFQLLLVLYDSGVFI